ncbi:MAG: glycosyltransferase N-terminal domain-containing protein [Desulfonatronovibrio sp.]
MHKKDSIILALFMFLYFCAWLLVLPFLLFIKRLKPVCRQRFGLGMPSGPFDLWIHAASVGEAKLVLKFLEDLPRHNCPEIIISVNTLQGMKTLKDNIQDRAKLVFFPFDIYPVWAIALSKIRPRKILLLETEIWPALLFYCKIKSYPVTIGNARMSLKSFCRYYPLSTLLNQISPGKILAVSQRDQKRFAWIFKDSSRHRMPNIKFDIIKDIKPLPYVKNPLSAYFKAGQSIIVLGSVREEEELHIQWLISRISDDHPRTTIALFPRHTHRIQAWENFLENNNKSWIKRSKLEPGASLPSIIIWDKFGELLPAYALARSVFVGGSLAPCGGQNFLEPLSQGVVPCVGPFWENFHWVGKEIMSRNLLHQVGDKYELYSSLVKPPTVGRDKVIADFHNYVNNKSGGTARLINNLKC